ncbi:MAG TPA: aryl-sulfate sulfotransferase [Verrucomicrobiae bacterium]
MSGPTFTPASAAPLAGTLQIATDVNSRISVIISDGFGNQEKDFYDFSTNHSEILLGFKPNQTNQILVTVYDENQNSATAPQLLTFVTAPLPSNFPVYTVLTNLPSQMEPGYTLFIDEDRNTLVGFAIFMDNSGNVVWYKQTPQYSDADVRQLANGDLLFEEQPPNNDFVEINMLGQTVRVLHPPAQYPVNLHEALETSRGTLLYISDVSVSVPNFPSVLPSQSMTETNPPLKTVTMDDNPVVEINATNGALVNAWSMVNMIDPDRVTYLTGDSTTSYGVDNIHANAIIDDTNDNSIIVSMRDQNAVMKFSRLTGAIKWILGSPTNWPASFQQYFFTPVGSPFDWNWGQHRPTLTPQGTVLMYNDGDWRADPFSTPVPDASNYGSAEEFSLDETNMLISEVWNSQWQTNQDRLYSQVVGKAQWLPQTRDVLVTYGYVQWVNGLSPNPKDTDGSMPRIKEYTHDPIPQVVFDLAMWNYTNTSSTYIGNLVYRATRIPHLYPHPLVPVPNLVINLQNQIPVLTFSADPTYTYSIQQSTDLKNWTIIGTALKSGSAGDYFYFDLDANDKAMRYYRVMAQ